MCTHLQASVHSLGVLLDLGLLPDVEVAPVNSSAYYHLRLVHQLRPFLLKKLPMPKLHPGLTIAMHNCGSP